MRLFNLLFIVLAGALFVETSAATTVNSYKGLTEAEIKAEKAKASEYQACLANLFVDLSCNELKEGITAANLPGNENYTKLSEPLKAMVDKIAANDWSEDYSDLNLKDTYPLLDEESWDDGYARKYRVQDYEPYSESAASELVGVSRYTNMNNPTGIVGDKGDLIYVMVKDAVPEGATLYINEVWNPADMYNNASAGTQLKQGLNIIDCKNENSHFFIYYCVQTVKQTNGKYVADEKHNLLKYNPMTIHIEGGRLNGFFNYVGDARYQGDTQEDFAYTVQRATHPMYNLIGKYVILHFHLEDSPAVVGEEKLYPCVKTVLFREKGKHPDREYDPVKILAAWDRMCFTERILMGLQSDAEVNDSYNQNLYEPNSAPHSVTVGGQTFKSSPGFQYNEYFNNKLFGMSRQSEGLFMSAGDWRTSYNVYTIEAVLTQFTQGDIWGPAHEYGHMNQRLINMAGTTEESNNIFSNVVVYFQGKNTSRSDFISSQFDIFQSGKPFLENGTWGTTRMFWQLWCYYHATGHNKKFYPRLFELLRNYPIVKTIRPGKHNERYDKLQFAKMCCIAAEEDLTNFFTAWGFFVPLELYTFADYSTYDTYLTEEDIRIVKDEIASFDFPKNDAIIFIDDRVNSSRESYSGFPKENAGDFGGFDAFNEDRAPSGTFSYAVDINTVTVTADGDPGAGFIIKDKDGNLLGFSNSKTFTVNDELAEKLRTGEAVMEAVGANNDTQKVVNQITDGSIEEKTELLRKLYASSSDLLSKVDPTETKVGFLLKGKVTELQKLVGEVGDALRTGNVSSEEITEYINAMTTEFNRVVADDESFIRLEPGSLYRITNTIRKTDEALTYSNGMCATAKPGTPGTSADAKFQWNFVPGFNEGEYYIQNWETKAYLGKYASSPQSGIPMQYSGGYKYNVIPAREKDSFVGYFVLAPFDDLNLALHIGGNGSLIGYTSGAGASKWYITKVVDSDNVDMSENYRQLLENLIKQYQELKNEIDPLGVNVGFLKPEAAEVFDANCEAVTSALEGGVENAELATFYKDQVQLYKNLSQWGSYVRIDIEPGAAYTLKNVYEDTKYHQRLLYSDDTYVSTTQTTDSKGFASQWVFEDSGIPGVYAVRNMDNNKYVPAGMDANKYLRLTESAPGYYGLIEEQDYTGQFGIGLDGKISDVIITKEMENPGDKSLTRMGMLAVLAGDESKWTLKRVHEKEYVELREQLINLVEEGIALMSANYQIPGMDIYEWLDYWEKLEDAKEPTKSPETTIEDLQNQVANVESIATYLQARISEDKIVTVSEIGSFNDGEDNNIAEEDGKVRHAFNMSESISFYGLISFEDLDDADNILVEIKPLGTGQWLSSSSAGIEDLLEDYREEFAKSAPGAALFEQLIALECDYVDGFFTKAEGRLQKSRRGDAYDLIVSVPCSGLYKVSLKGKNGCAVFDTDLRIPSFLLEVYPNLKGKFNATNGINIEGYTFSDSYPERIYLPEDFVASHDLKSCTVNIPGLYFVDSFKVANETVSLSREALNSGASKYSAKVDLSGLKNVTDADSAEKLNISVSKNGATADYIFVVVKDRNVSTEVGRKEAEEETPVYYDIHGIRVDNPRNGIYIRRAGNRAEKVVIK